MFEENTKSNDEGKENLSEDEIPLHKLSKQNHDGKEVLDEDDILLVNLHRQGKKSPRKARKLTSL